MSIHFTERDWERIECDWTAWWAGELDRPLVVVQSVETLSGGNLPETPRFVANFPLEAPAAEILDCHQARLDVTRFWGDAWPKWFPNFGPGVIPAFLGAQMQVEANTIWFASTAQSADIADLHLAYDPDNAWWRRVCAICRSAVERWGRQVTVAYTDLGCNLDILAALRTTQQLLLDLHDAPREVTSLLSEIRSLWFRYYEELSAIVTAPGRGTTCWAPIWSPGRCYMLQCDFAYMISPRMFERFVLPEIAACCDFLDHGFYHLDGKGQIAHLDMLLSLNKLRGVQWIPGAGAAPAEEWLPLLARIRKAGKLCQVYVTPQGARTIVQELGGRGFAFYIVQGFDEEGFYAPLRMSRDEAQELIQSLSA